MSKNKTAIWKRICVFVLYDDLFIGYTTNGEDEASLAFKTTWFPTKHQE